NESAAKKFFPGEDAIGKRIDLGDHSDGEPSVWREIVGVSADVRRRALTDPPSAECYVPFYQRPSSYVAVAVRAKHDAAMGKQMHEAIQAVDPGQAVASV